MNEEAARTYHLGFVADPMPGDERFAGMLCIPYLSNADDAIALKFRRVDDSDGPKYDSPAGQKPHLYNARALVAGGNLAVVCEGELSAIIGASLLGVPVVGTPGTQWMEHWGRCFGDFDRVVIVADNDDKEDGSNPGLKHAKHVQKEVAGAELVLPPAGLDLDEWINNYGVDAVKGALGL